MRAVGVVSNAADAHARAVGAALAHRDVPVELLDLERFPRALALSCELPRGPQRLLDRADGRQLDLASLRSVWWRRPSLPRIDAAVRDADARQFALTESLEAWHGALRSLPARFINDIDRDAAASHKSSQLRAAAAAGMRVPRTLVTNDAGAARAFFEACGGRVVYKAFRATPRAWRETRALERADLDQLDGLHYAPVIFQERVDGPLDVRVIAIGARLFAASFDLRASRYPLDVRMDLTVPCAPFVLDAETSTALTQLMRALGLVYGAIDLRVDADGAAHFFEINTAGQFLYVEDLTRLPITDALAEELAREDTP